MGLDDYSFYHRTCRWLSIPQNAKDRHCSGYYTSRSCLLWVFRSKSWLLERRCRHIWPCSNSIWCTSYGDTTAKLRTHRRFCGWLHIFLSKHPIQHKNLCVKGGLGLFHVSNICMNIIKTQLFYKKAIHSLSLQSTSNIFIKYPIPYSSSKKILELRKSKQITKAFDYELIR